MGSSSSNEKKEEEFTKNVKSIFLDEADLGYREAFNIFDVNGNKKISSKEIQNFFGSSKDNQIILMQDALYKRDQEDEYEYSQFKKFLEYKTKEVSLNKKITNAFSVFDRNESGYISKNQIRYLLSSIGDQLTESEVTEFMLEIDKKGENINYSELAANLCDGENK